jgi:hypothetical protein
MAVFRLPTSLTSANYNFEVELSGVVFRLRFKFNSRSGFWYMSVENPQGDLLRTGIKVVNSWPLLVRWVDVLNSPQGDVLAFPTGPSSEPAGLNELGTRVVLNYIGDS